MKGQEKKIGILILLRLFSFSMSTTDDGYGQVCESVRPEHVINCPTSEQEFQYASDEMNCQEECPTNFVYHCVRDHDMKSLYKLCANRTYISAFCPEYNIGGNVVQHDHNFPFNYTNKSGQNINYIDSPDVYKYEGCLKINNSGIQEKTTIQVDVMTKKTVRHSTRQVSSGALPVTDNRLFMASLVLVIFLIPH